MSENDRRHPTQWEGILGWMSTLGILTALAYWVVRHFWMPDAQGPLLLRLFIVGSMLVALIDELLDGTYLGTILPIVVGIYGFTLLY